VRYPPSWSKLVRLAPVLLAGVSLLYVLTGCATTPAGSSVALPRGHAEIAVTNLTAHVWHLALRATEATDAIRVEVKPLETFAVTMPGGDYVVEQTLLAVGGSAPATRRFNARFDAGERYHWNLATLLARDSMTP
jgi:hypothetical protein